MATNESMSQGKFYYGSSSASPWVNDLLHKSNVQRELKRLQKGRGKKSKLTRAMSAPQHMRSAHQVSYPCQRTPTAYFE